MASAQVKSAILFAALGAELAHDRCGARANPTDDRRDVLARRRRGREHGRRATDAASPFNRADRSRGTGRCPAIPPRPRSSPCSGRSTPTRRSRCSTSTARRERVGFLGVLQRMGATMTLRARDSMTTLTRAVVSADGHRRARQRDPSVDEVPGARRRRGGGRRRQRLSRRRRTAREGVRPLRGFAAPGDANWAVARGPRATTSSSKGSAAPPGSRRSRSTRRSITEW